MEAPFLGAYTDKRELIGTEYEDVPGERWRGIGDPKLTGDPEAIPSWIVPRRIDAELQRLEKEGQQLRAENEARTKELQDRDWLIPAEKAKLVSGELTQEQAAEMGQYRKRMFTEAKAMRDEAKRPKTGRERFIKTVINNPMFGGIDPRFIDRQKAKKELKGVKLAEYKKAHQESFNKDATGSTLFKMMVTSTQEADQEIDSNTDKQITILDNLIKHYDGREKARMEAAQKARREVVKMTIQENLKRQAEKRQEQMKIRMEERKEGAKIREEKREAMGPEKLSERKFKFGKKLTSIEVRSNLIQGDKNVYDNYAGFFNNINTRNEVAYWDVVDWGSDKTKIIKLPPNAVKAKWTAKRIQEAADQKGKTIREVLKDIGVLR